MIAWTDGATIRDVIALPSWVGNVTDLALVGDRIWFTAYRSTSKPTQYLYYVDNGVPRRIAHRLSGPQHVRNLTPVGDKLYFSASVVSGASGADLWVTDGTDAGTHPVDSRSQAQRAARNPILMRSTDSKTRLSPCFSSAVLTVEESHSTTLASFAWT